MFVREKLQSIAILKTLGADTQTIIYSYLGQAVGLGVLGSAVGIGIGLLLQAVLPQAVSTVLATDVLQQVEFTSVLSWTALAPLAKALSYGHSNGWVETKKELIEHLESGYMEYNSFREDSIKVEVNGNVAHARFIAEINATMSGKEFTFQLRVLEVWVKKGKRWVLFARQAVRK